GTDVREFGRVLAESGLPVVVGLEGNARGAGWLAGLCAEGCVYSAQGQYSCAQGWGLGGAIELLRWRLGPTLGTEVLLTGADYRGTELGERRGTLRVVESEQVLAQALA